MKNKILLAALVIALVFGMVSCKNDPAAPDSGTISGNTITSGAAVTYPDDIAEAAKNATDFSYLGEWENDTFKGTVPISNMINAPTTVTVSGGKVTIELGEPKYLEVPDFIHWYNTVNITNSAVAKYYSTGSTFYTSDGKYYLRLEGKNSFAELVYVDKDTKISGQGKTTGFTDNWNTSLKKGWNYLIQNNTNTADNIWSITASTKVPSGLEWIVGERN